MIIKDFDKNLKWKTTINFLSTFLITKRQETTRVFLHKVSFMQRLTMNEPQASDLANTGKFRKHSVEEESQPSKLRKTEKQKKEKARKAKETTSNSQLQPAEKVPKEIQPPQELSLPAQEENPEEEKDGEPEQMPRECVEKTNQSHDKAHHHAVVFFTTTG